MHVADTDILLASKEDGGSIFVQLTRAKFKVNFLVLQKYSSCYISGWLHEGFGSYDEAFYIAGSVAIFSSLLLFGVDYMIRRQFKASKLVEHKDTKNNTSLISCDDSSASDTGYKDTESQPMLEEECASTHCSLKISELLLLIDRETVL